MLTLKFVLIMDSGFCVSTRGRQGCPIRSRFMGFIIWAAALAASLIQENVGGAKQQQPWS